MGLRSGDNGGHTMIFFSFYARSSQAVNGVFGSMGWGIVLHENDLISEGMILLSIPWQKLVA